MPTTGAAAQDRAAIPVDRATLFVSLELSRSRWLVTSLSPGSAKLSNHTVAGGDGNALLDLLALLQSKAARRVGVPVKIVAIQEAGLDGFWIHRLLVANGIESHVVEGASIAVPRRRRRTKTDMVDGEMLVRTLAAFKRDEPRVCSMVVPPSPAEEDRRRLSRERRTLIKERVEHSNRIKGLLASQGIRDYQPLRRDCRERLAELQTGDGRPLLPRLKAEIIRELDRLKLVRQQITEVEAARDALLQSQDAEGKAPAKLLLRLMSIGPEFATVLWLEGLSRTFRNRRQLAAYAGLAPSPWRSGRIDREQGISKAGNPRLRSTMIELAWLWLRHQPDSSLSRWFHARVQANRSRIRRIAIVALARKLLIALWRYVSQGEVPEGARLKTT
jgi:transposase